MGGPGARADRIWLGILCVVAATLAFAIASALAKWLVQTYALGQVVFFRCLFSLVPVFVVVLVRRGRFVWRTQRFTGHLVRSVCGLLGMTGLFVSLSLLPMADAVAIIFAGPIFATMLSVPLLGETVGPRRWAAVLVGFLGVLLVVQPGAAGFQPAAVLAIGTAFLFGLVPNLIRQLTMTESDVTIVLYYMLISTAISSLALPFGWRMPDLADFALFLALGLTGGIGQLLMTQGFRQAPVVVVAPFDYLSIPWAGLLGYLLWGEVMVPMTIAGTALVIASGLYILHREAVRRREEGQDHA